MMLEIFSEKIRNEINKGLPGPEAHCRMAPELRRPFPGNDHATRDAGVLILLFPVSGHINTFLIKRTDYQGVHRGQISFPGGKKEEGDRNLVQTAIRETEEELGISLKKVNVIGQLSELHIPVSSFTVYPFVASLPCRPVTHPDRNEVDYVIQVPLKNLLRPGSIRSARKEILSRPVDVPYFDLNGKELWGATAMIMNEFLELLRRSGILQQV